MAPRIAVRVRDVPHARIAWAVASHPEAGTVGMVGRKPPPSWKELVTEIQSTAGYDVVVDPEDDDDAAFVVVAGSSERCGITHASPRGLAQALTVRLPGSIPVWTVVGDPHRSGMPVALPPPIGTVMADHEGAAPIQGAIAAAAAVGDDRIVVVVDDRAFLEAVCIAAGAFITDGVDRPTPVWERAEAYLAACETLGLVIAEGS